MLANFQRVVFLELWPQTPLPTIRAKPWSSGSGPGMAVGHGEMAKAGWGRLAGKRVKDVELDCYSILQLIHDYIVIVFHNHCFHMFRFMNHTSCIHTLSFSLTSQAACQRLHPSTHVDLQHLESI